MRNPPLHPATQPPTWCWLQQLAVYEQLLQPVQHPQHQQAAGGDAERQADVRLDVQAQRLKGGQVAEQRRAQPQDVQGVQVQVAPEAARQNAGRRRETEGASRQAEAGGRQAGQERQEGRGTMTS